MKEKISSSPIFSIVSRILFAPIIIFGLYVQFHGDYGPGGGVSGWGNHCSRIHFILNDFWIKKW